MPHAGPGGRPPRPRPLPPPPPPVAAPPPYVLLCCLPLLCAFLSSVVGAEGGALLGAELVCGRGLTERQRALCRAAPAAVGHTGRGLSMAYAECRAQLAGRRWNCSGVGGDSPLGHVLPLGTKEAAFTYALTAAGVTHALGAACARGDLPACGCGARRNGPVGGGGGGVSSSWAWGGCDGAAWGGRFARRFLDARELEADARTAMNLHNNRLGRKLVRSMVRRECKCHGVSGSCAVRTCWRALPAFPAVGAALRDKYLRARRVWPAPPPPRDWPAPAPPPPHPPPPPPRAPADRAPRPLPARTLPQLVVKSRSGRTRAPRRSELVFLDPSPSYCEPQRAAAAPGTHGRVCNLTSTGEDGCARLCCGRGHAVRRVVRRARCRCSFRWCCAVTCSLCLSAADVAVCN